MGVGHPFTQGTVDSNEVWVDFTATSSGKIIGRSGALAGPDDSGAVDEWAHCLNVLMLDRQGNRINRRNPQDIFTPLYNHQIPPGAAQVVHYELKVPDGGERAGRIGGAVRYRKFDFEYMSLVHGSATRCRSCPSSICVRTVSSCRWRAMPRRCRSKLRRSSQAWQRWNDYGIGCLIEGGAEYKKGELRQAEEAFQGCLKAYPEEAVGHAYLNLARVYEKEAD